VRRLLVKVVDAPRLSIGIVLMLTAFAVAAIGNLRIDVSPSLLMVGDDPAISYYDTVKERFGSDDLTAVVVEAPDVFSPEVLASVERLTDAILAMSEVSRVDSLTTVHEIRGEDDWLSTDLLMKDGVPDTPERVARLRAAALRNPTIAGNLVSKDARATAVLAYSEPHPGDVGFDRRFTQNIERLVFSERAATGLTIYQFGGPYLQTTLTEAIVGDQTFILPIASLVLTVVLYAVFRSSQAVLIPATTRVVSICWALGLMGVLDYPVTILTMLIPLLLICVGFTEDVHLISEYRQQLEQGKPKHIAIHDAMDSLAVPLVVTSFTTAVGFASLSLSDITILRQLGHVAPAAFACSFFATLFLVPSLLRYWPEAEIARDQQGAEPRVATWLDRLLETLGSFDIRRRRLIYAIAALLLTVGALGLPRVAFENDLVGFFRPGSELHRRMDDIHRALAGGLMFYLVVDTDHEGGAAEPEVLRVVSDLQNFLAGTGKVDQTVSIADYIKTINREMNGGDDAYWVVPDSRELITQYLLLLHPENVEQSIDYEQRSANIVVRYNLSSTREVGELLAQIDDYVAANVPAALRVTATGEWVLLARSADYLMGNMLTSLVYTVMIVTVACSLFFMSWKVGLLSLVPNIVPVVFVFGLLAMTGVPVNVGTAMIAAIAVGIAVDDTLHYMARNSMELDRYHDQAPAMRRTLESEGRAIVATSLALAGGLSALVFGSFVPLEQFGVVSAVVILVALACDLTLTPALMVSTRLTTLWDIVGLRLNADICEVAPLFRGMRHWEARKVVLAGRLERLATGGYAIHAGTRDESDMYVVLTGRLQVKRDHEQGQAVLAELAPGDIFGEMAAVDRRERSADVVALTDSEVLALRMEDLTHLRKRFPWTAVKLFENLSRILSERLRARARSVLPHPVDHAA
jgi:hydrophobe/amphiphile efflux-3 (HAE3) family protein